jgi:hypothetical protein
MSQKIGLQIYKNLPKQKLINSLSSNPSQLVEMRNQLTLNFESFDYFEMFDLELGIFQILVDIFP